MPRYEAVGANSSLLTGLLDLDDFATDQPVRLDHRGVDAASNLPSRLLEDLRDALVELVIITR